MRVRHKTPLKKSAEYRRLKKSLQTFVQLHPDEGRRFLQAERELESDLQVSIWHPSAHTCYVCFSSRDLSVLSIRMQARTLSEPNSLPLDPDRHDALQLVEADKAEHAHRSVGRLLRAGTEYRFEEASRAVCVESYKALLGRFFPESGLPSFGGRLFLAGVSRSRGSFSQQTKAPYRPTSVARAANKLLLSILQFILHAQAVFFHVLWHFVNRMSVAGVLANMLQRPVSLTDIATWFHKPTNQSLEVHEDLKILLWQNGLSWPPLAENMSQCGAYRLTLFKNVSSLGKLPRTQAKRVADCYHSCVRCSRCLCIDYHRYQHCH